MDKLEDFFYHEDQIVADVAQQLKVLEDGRYNGDLSEEQFQELVQDLLEVEEVKNMSDTLDRKIMILQAFNALKTIVGVLAK